MEEPRHFLFFLGHPAHFHLFRNTWSALQTYGHRITICIKPKDVLEPLLVAAQYQYINMLPEGRGNGKWNILKSTIKKAWRLLMFCRKNRPDILVGTSAEIAWVGRLLGIPSLVFAEDDAHVIDTFARLVYPFATSIVSPVGCDNGRWNAKTIRYKGTQKLAYLHPKVFVPDFTLLDQYKLRPRMYSVVRLANLNAHHDTNASGFTVDLLRKVVRLLQKEGEVIISSETHIPDDLKPGIVEVFPEHLHSVLAFARLYVGDSQSMAVEAAVMGTPSIRYSSFYDQIGIVNKLEKEYLLLQSVSSKDEQALINLLEAWLEDSNLNDLFLQRRNKMLEKQDDVSEWITLLLLSSTLNGK